MLAACSLPVRVLPMLYLLSFLFGAMIAGGVVWQRMQPVRQHHSAFDQPGAFAPKPVVTLFEAAMLCYIGLQLWILFDLLPPPDDLVLIQRVFFAGMLIPPLLYFVFEVCGQITTAINDPDNFEVRHCLVSVLVSGLAMVVGFSNAFFVFGLEPPDGQAAVSRGDAIYVAAVTFSTLGYGDFTPAANTRALAACLAVIGNLHLAALVGIALSAISTRPEE